MKKTFICFEKTLNMNELMDIFLFQPGICSHSLWHIFHYDFWHILWYNSNRWLVRMSVYYMGIYTPCKSSDRAIHHKYTLRVLGTCVLLEHLKLDKFSMKNKKRVGHNKWISHLGNCDMTSPANMTTNNVGIKKLFALIFTRKID